MSPEAAQAAGSRKGLIEGDYLLTAEDFRRIADMLYADAGIVLSENKATLVYSRLSKRLRTLGLESFRAYCALVAGSDGLDERQQMLSALTTNHTRFMREPHHFDHLRQVLLPPLLARAKAGGRVRLWSAACSNGSEPYSMALEVLGLMPDAAEHDVRILATDIDPKMVEAGRAGVYSAEALSPLAAPVRERWFKRSGGDFEAAPALRKLVAFRELNLLGDWPMQGRFDAIFCRNVVIYFDDQTQSRLWTRLVGRLDPGGRLYIGHSERVAGPAADQLTPEGVTLYRRLEGKA